jgi:GTPase SAR1 family protein
MIHGGKNELKKMLLMGQHNAGKTSIYVIIFGNTSPRVNENTFKFMGNL